MNTNLNLEVNPLEVPYYVSVVTPKVPGSDAEPFSVPVENVDAITLEALCREFRDRLFEKAGKSPPPGLTPPDTVRLDVLNTHMQQLDARVWGEIFGVRAVNTRHLREAIDLL